MVVGKPTIFFSHAWRFPFRNVVAALRSFVDFQLNDTADGESQDEVFFWFDCFSIDEHATQALPQEWWATTFKEAIGLIGHTVMLLSPWDGPVPLSRAWCLWELYCTVTSSNSDDTEGAAAKGKFSVCLGPAEAAAFERAVLKDPQVGVRNSIFVLEC